MVVVLVWWWVYGFGSLGRTVDEEARSHELNVMEILWN